MVQEENYRTAIAVHRHLEAAASGRNSTVDQPGGQDGGDRCWKSIASDHQVITACRRPKWKLAGGCFTWAHGTSGRLGWCWMPDECPPTPRRVRSESCTQRALWPAVMQP